MNITARLDMLINGAFANGQTDTFNALRLLRDDAARLEADGARLDWLDGKAKVASDGFKEWRLVSFRPLRAAIDAAKGDA